MLQGTTARAGQTHWLVGIGAGRMSRPGRHWERYCCRKIYSALGYYRHSSKGQAALTPKLDLASMARDRLSRAESRTVDHTVHGYGTAPAGVAKAGSGRPIGTNSMEPSGARREKARGDGQDTVEDSVHLCTAELKTFVLNSCAFSRQEGLEAEICTAPFLTILRDSP